MSGMLFDIPQPEEPAKNPTPELTNAPYKHSVVESKKTPIETLASYIGGSNFYCVYYSQKFTKSEELKAFDPLQLNVYQQYHKINDFIIFMFILHLLFSSIYLKRTIIHIKIRAKKPITLALNACAKLNPESLSAI